MTVESETRSVVRTADGVGRGYSFPFNYYDQDHVQVERLDIGATEYVVVFFDQYEIENGAGNAQDGWEGGTVNYPPSPHPVFPAGTKIRISRIVPYLQTDLDVTNASGFDPRGIERALDLVVMRQQQLAGAGDDANYVVAPDGVSPALPAPEANKLLGWNSTETALENKDPGEGGGGGDWDGLITTAGGDTERDIEEKLGEIISFEDFGADPTGIADSKAAMQAALATGLAIRLRPGARYRVGGTSGITIPAGTKIIGRGADIKLSNGAGAFTNKMTIGDSVYIEELRVIVDGGTTSGYMVDIGADFRSELVAIAPDLQCSDTTTSAVRCAGSSLRIGQFVCRNHDRPLTIDNRAGLTGETGWRTAQSYTTNTLLTRLGAFYRVASNHTSGDFATDLAAGKLVLIPKTSRMAIDSIRIADYVQGVHIWNATSFWLRTIDIRNPSANAVGAAAACGLTLNGCDSFHISDLTVVDPEQNGLRIAGTGAEGFTIDAIRVWRPKESAVRFVPGHANGFVKSFTLGKVLGFDVGRGASSGDAELLHFFLVSQGTIGSAIAAAQAQATSCRRGISLNSCSNLRVENLYIPAPASGLIEFDSTVDGFATTQTASGPCSSIYIKGGGSAPVGGAVRVNFSGLALANIGLDLDLTALTVPLVNVAALGSTTGQVVVTGSVDGDEPSIVGFSGDPNFYWSVLFEGLPYPAETGGGGETLTPLALLDVLEQTIAGADATTTNVANALIDLIRIGSDSERVLFYSDPGNLSNANRSAILSSTHLGSGFSGPFNPGATVAFDAFGNPEGYTFGGDSPSEILNGTPNKVPPDPEILSSFFKKGEDIASASTITIPAGICSHVTGNTTINTINMSFDGTAGGRFAMLIFDGTPQVTHGANLVVTTSGANWLAAANKMALVFSDGATKRYFTPLDGSGGVGGGLADGDYGDIEVSGSGTAMAIKPGAVGLGQMADVDQYDIYARSTAGTGEPELLASSSNVFSILGAANYSAIRTLLSLVPGTHVQAQDAELSAIAGLTSAADKGIYFTGSGSASVFDLSSFARTFTALTGITRHEWVPANAMTPRPTSPAEEVTVELATNKVVFDALAFSTSADEFAQWTCRAPKRTAETTLAFIPVWTHPSTATNFSVLWGIQALARSNDDAGDTAFGTAVTSQGEGGTTSDIYMGATTGACTPAGTWAEGDLLFFQIYRDVDGNGTATNDDLAVDAYLLGVLMIWTENAMTDA